MNNVSYYLLEADVAGRLGENTIMDTTVHPPRIDYLHYEIDDWSGDDLLESTPGFIITQHLADRLSDTDLTGYRLTDAEVTLSETGVELLAGTTLPTFSWLQVTGTSGVDDFGLTSHADLIVSTQALDTPRNGNLDNADIEPWTAAETSLCSPRGARLHPYGRTLPWSLHIETRISVDKTPAREEWSPRTWRCSGRGHSPIPVVIVVSTHVEVFLHPLWTRLRR